MSCPRCGGMSAVDLAAAMDELVCGWAVIEGPYCHCDEIEGSQRACPLRDKSDNSAEPPDGSATSKSRRP